jgi:DNA-directed RNA polymerase subunit RPC12/RpoP
MLDGTSCPACGGRVADNADGTYSCINCEADYEYTDVFLP